LTNNASKHIARTNCNRRRRPTTVKAQRVPQGQLGMVVAIQPSVSRRRADTSFGFRFNWHPLFLTGTKIKKMTQPKIN